MCLCLQNSMFGLVAITLLTRAWLVVAMVFQVICSWWFLGLCKAVSMVFSVIASMLLLSMVAMVFQIFSGAFWVVSRVLLWCSWWFLGFCRAVTMVFRAIAKSFFDL